MGHKKNIVLNVLKMVMIRVCVKNNASNYKLPAITIVVCFWSKLNYLSFRGKNNGNCF